MRYVFDVIDDNGELRSYVSEFMRRDNDKLVVRYRGLEVRLEISRICDWCSVDETSNAEVVFAACGLNRLSDTA